MTITPVVIEDSSLHDLLNRQSFVDQLLNITDALSKTRKNACYAITGDWGAGKSFVLDMFEAQAGVICQEGPISEKYLIFRYNCWEYDYYDEPLVAIVASMLDQIDEKVKLLPSDLKTKVVTGLKEAGKGLLKISAIAIKEKSGIDLSVASDVFANVSFGSKSEFEDKHDYNQYFGFKKNLKKLQKEIVKLSEYQTVMFVVDELDRCLPEYTIKVLERLHHLFSGVPNAQTILSLDINQLEHTVHQIFGDKTDAKMYLRKFIDFEVRLDLGTIDDSFYGRFADYFNCFESKDNIADFQEVNQYCSLVLEGMDMRSRFAIVDRCKLLHSLLYTEENADYCYLCLELLLVILKDTKIDTVYAKNHFNISHLFDDNSLAPENAIVPDGLKKLSDKFAKNKDPRLNYKLYDEDRIGREPYVHVEDRVLLGRLLCAYRAVLGFADDHYSSGTIGTDASYDTVYGFTEYARNMWDLMKTIR